MPVNKDALRRYKIIDECLRNKFKPYPNMEDILDVLQEKIGDFHKSTIQKDIEAMKEGEPYGYNAPIGYSRRFGGYYYKDPNFSINSIPLNEEELEALYAASDLLKVFSGSRMSQYYNEAVLKIGNAVKVDYPTKGGGKALVIDMEHPIAHRGIEHFQVLTEAAQKKIPVCFIHYSYSKRRFASIILHTYLLKEFHNRWYVIGYSEKHKEFRTFGLDRIYDPLLLDLPFKEEKYFNSEYYSTDMFGLLPLQGYKKMKVVFNVKPLLGNYFLSNPLHMSQVVTKYYEYGALEITIHVIPTRELLNELYMYTPNLKVLSPAFLKEEINQMHKKSLADEKLKHNSKDHEKC